MKDSKKTLSCWLKFSFFFWLLLFCSILSSCAFSSPTITAPVFESIPIGASISEVKTQIGKPYRITTGPNGVEYYQYIERLETGPGIITQNTYLFTVMNGQITDKQSANSARSLNLQIR